MIAFVFILWYVVLCFSLAFPPLFIVTALPLILTAKGVHEAIKGDCAQKRAREAWAVQEEEFRNARQARSWLR